MADSSKIPSLDPAIQPFYPGPHVERSSSGSETDDSQQVFGSPISLEPSIGQSSEDGQLQVAIPLGVIGPPRETASSRWTSPAPGLLSHPAFQDYKIGAIRSGRSSLNSDTGLSTRSISPVSLRGPSPYHTDDYTPRINNVQDMRAVSPDETDDGPGTARNSITPLGDLKGSFPPNAFLQPPSRNNSQLVGNISVGRSTLGNNSENTDNSSLSSPGSNSKGNSMSSSIDLSLDNEDNNHPMGASNGLPRDLAPLGRNYPLQPGSMSSLSSRSFSNSYEPQTATSRNTTPFSQMYDEQGLTSANLSVGGVFQGQKIPFIPQQPGAGTDRNSLSRASSRSMSINGTQQAYDRPPSSFDMRQQPTVSAFDVQAKASPFINDLLDRLLRCEYSTKEIQRELSDVTRKVNFLVEKAVASENARGAPQQQQQQQQVPGGAEDVRALSQRLASLTTSVSQLLVLQTQQHMHSIGGTPTGGPAAFGGGPNANAQSANVNNNNNNNNANTFAPPNGPPPSGLNTNANNLGPMYGGNVAHQQQQQQQMNIGGNNYMHLLPTRPENTGGPPPSGHRGSIRGATMGGPPPSRNWPLGNGDMMQRSASDAGLPGSVLGGGINGMNALMRDKRKMSLGLARRESTSTIGEESVGGRDRDNGPVISKWEHLPLLPELLRSINKYGIGPPNKIQQRALPFLLRGSDIIAQAPPTQERIAAYIIPAIHVVMNNLATKVPNRGPIVVILSTTVDQATQAQRMIRDLGGPIGVRSALGVGTGGDIVQELRLLQQNIPHIICGTPQKLHALFTSPGGLPGHEVRFLVLDEVDQLIARNLHEFVFNIVKLFPAPRSKTSMTSTTPAANNVVQFNPFDTQYNKPIGRSTSPPGAPTRRFSVAPGEMDVDNSLQSMQLQTNPQPSVPERQTALFSNTVPQDVLNLANAIQLREAVRVLVRRDGNVTHADTSNGARGLRQFYLYLAFTAGVRPDPTAANLSGGAGAGVIGSGRGATSAETSQAREWKLDALADLFDDIEIPQVIVHVGGLTSLESVVYKLVSRGFEAVPLHSDMSPGAKLAALNKFRATNSPIGRPPITRVLVVCDVPVKAPEVHQVPLVINYDLPKAVEEYAHRVAPAVSSSYSRAGVVINFVTATGGDVEMLRSIECFYKIKCPEVPMSLRDVI